jgi:hypothetical protein
MPSKGMATAANNKKIQNFVQKNNETAKYPGHDGLAIHPH